MADIVFVSIVLAFFAAAGGFVVLCDRVLGPSATVSAVASSSRPPAEVAPAQVP